MALPKKMLKGDFGSLEIEIPRDRDAEFEPKIIKKKSNPLAWF